MNKKKSKKFRLLAALSILLMSAVFFGCKSQPQEFSKTEFLMGTVCTITVNFENQVKSIDEAFKAVKKLEKLMTIKSGSKSEIVNLNDNAGNGKFVKLSKDTFKVLERAIYFSKMTQGGFDPTVGVLTTKWNIGTDQARVPSKAEIAKGLSLIDYKRVVLDPKNSRARLMDKGMMVDLGAIAKGYAGDIVKEVLDKAGVKSAIINLGGNIVLDGLNPQGGKWKVGIQDPMGNRGSYFGIVETDDEAVVSSGIYERYLEAEGKKYHHILNPKTGYPTENGVVATTIVSKSSIDADGYSTSIFALGVKEGMMLMEKNGIDGMVIDDKKHVFITNSLKTKFKLVDTTYKIVD